MKIIKVNDDKSNNNNNNNNNKIIYAVRFNYYFLEIFYKDIRGIKVSY